MPWPIARTATSPAGARCARRRSDHTRLHTRTHSAIILTPMQTVRHTDTGNPHPHTDIHRMAVLYGWEGNRGSSVASAMRRLPHKRGLNGHGTPPLTRHSLLYYIPQTAQLSLSEIARNVVRNYDNERRLPSSRPYR